MVQTPIYIITATDGTIVNYEYSKDMAEDYIQNRIWTRPYEVLYLIEGVRCAKNLP